MKTETKVIRINSIIHTLKESVQIKNKKLCKENLHSEQVPFDEGDMFIQLMFKTDGELNRIARFAGV